MKLETKENSHPWPSPFRKGRGRIFGGSISKTRFMVQLRGCPTKLDENHVTQRKVFFNAC